MPWPPGLPASASCRRASWSWAAALARSRLTPTCAPASLRALPSLPSASAAAARSPFASACAASRSACAAPEPACWAAPSSPASCSPIFLRSASVFWSRFFARSATSCRAFSTSPPGFAEASPVAARERPRPSAASEAARCSLEGSSWSRTAASMPPSFARFASRSPGRSRSWRARSRSSSARRVRGSVASWPFLASSSATRSIRSAWRTAASRTWRASAIRWSIALGSRRSGARSAIATPATSAGRRAIRGRKRPAGTIARARAVSARWRVTKAARAAASTDTGSPESGVAPAANASALAARSRRPPSRSTAMEVSPRPGRAWTTAPRSRTAPATGSAAAIAGASSSGIRRARAHSAASAATTPASAYHARRVARRSQSRSRCRRSAARIERRSGSSGPAGAASGGIGRREVAAALRSRSGILMARPPAAGRAGDEGAATGGSG